MLINFLNSELVTNISSSVCECDGHSVKNLISKVELERGRGYLADSFIKPPITIDVQFVCEIQLSHVILWTRVGGQKTIGVDLLASNRECDPPQSIGCAFMENCNEDGFLFFKRGDNSLNGFDTSKLVLQTFKSTKLNRIRHLQIKILKTLASSVPALKKVEIWGEICKDCPKKTVDFVMSAWACINNVSTVQFNKPKESATTNKCTDVTSDNSHDLITNQSQFQIPDEFIDPITCDIMTIPMILPSGKIIDNSTLERYIREEEKWGRFPSDPFTGKLFSEMSRPKVSISLKTRIDKFLLDNSDKSFCKNLPRSVGHSEPFFKGPKVSSLVSNNKCNSTSNDSVSYSCNDYNLNVKHNILTKTDRNNKRKISFTKNISLNENKPASENELHPRKLQVVSGKAVFKQNRVSSLDKMKEQSLDFSLKTVLSNLPSFTKTSCPDDYRIACFKCKSVSILYELPCKHHVCRHCLSVLLETNSCSCLICFVGFNSGDPKRVHLTNF